MGTLVALVLAAAGGDSPFLRRDPARVEAEYLAVAPPEFAGALDALLSHRAKGRSVALVRTDDVAALHGPGPEGIAKLVAAVRPKFLLLAGDADRVPTFRRKADYVSEKFASDPDLATDHLFGAIAGRFPADSADELRAMAEKTVEYETSLEGGRWQKKITFVAGEGGFGAAVDAMIENQFATLVADRIPPAYDVEVAYGKASSKYGFYPPKFNEHALRLVNEGPLFFVYAGHGLRSAFDDIGYKGFVYPILRAKDAAKVEAAGGGFPIMVVLACNTGEYDSKLGDSIGEELVKRPRGPAAFIGGTRTTQPYANALLGHQLVRRAFDPELRTLGEVLWSSKEALSAKDDSKLRLQADALAALVQGPASLEPMRKDVILHYNLLGDPALAVRRPPGEITIEDPGVPRPGARLVVRGAAASGPVQLTLECRRDRFCRPVDDPAGEDMEKEMGRRYVNANDKVILSAEATPAQGSFEAVLAIPDNLKPGRYVLKAWSDGALGAREFEVRD
jgi:hypothetical protein